MREFIRKIGLIGDIHAEHERLLTAIDYLQGQDIDQLVCVGDVVDGVGDVDECCRLLLGTSVLNVRGNHERWLLTGSYRDLTKATPLEDISQASIRYLSSLTSTVDIATVSGRALVCHGLGTNDMALIRPTDEGSTLLSNQALQKLLEDHGLAYLLCGHSHLRMVRKIRQLTVINPGALIEKDAGFCIVDFQLKTATFFGIKSNLKIKKISKVKLNGKDWLG